VLTFQNRVKVHCKRMSDLVPFSPRRAPKVCQCHTCFSEENRMHLICVPGLEIHTYDTQMSVISQDIAQNVQKRFINFYYTYEGIHEGL
jgi:hypothetical protein